MKIANYPSDTATPLQQKTIVDQNLDRFNEAMDQLLAELQSAGRSIQTIQFQMTEPTAEAPRTFAAMVIWR